MKSLDLIEAANASLGSPTRPTEACLRRATSTAYYALFHCLAREGADLLIGGAGAQRSRSAWIQTYRALEHGHARKQCENSTVIKEFPTGIEDFADAFKTLQIRRHTADYDPLAKFYKSTVKADITIASKAIDAFRKTDVSDRRAFCAWVLFKVPRK